LFDIPLKTGLRRDLRDNRLSLRILFFCLTLLFVFRLAGSSSAEAAETGSGAVTSVGPGPQFAIADFDGDARADLARIQAGSNSSGTTDYWIQLQLTVAGWESIRLVAPAGGLWIEARDVNGDHAIDLVVATAWFNQPVAILLNDGHGSFSRVEPSAFPEAFSESEADWDFTTNQAIVAVGVPPQSRAGIALEARGPLYDGSPAGPIRPSCFEFIEDCFLGSHAGRSPPIKVSQS
jgi:hypothetical protein